MDFMETVENLLAETNKADCFRGHKMLTKKLADEAPTPYSTHDQGEQAMVFVKWFSPYTGWTWYATELDPATGQAFGLVSGDEIEIGYFNIWELGAQTKMNGKLPIVERDCYFKPCTLGEAYEMSKGQRS